MAVSLSVLLVVLVVVDTVLASIALRVLLAVVVVPDIAPVSKVSEVDTPPEEGGEVSGMGLRLGGPKVVDSVAVLMLRTIELGGVLGAPYGRLHGPAPSPNSRQCEGLAGTRPDIGEAMAGVIVVVVEMAGTGAMEDSILPLSASTEKMLVPAAAAERRLVPVVLLKTAVVIWVCGIVDVVSLRSFKSVLGEAHCGKSLYLRSCA